MCFEIRWQSCVRRETSVSCTIANPSERHSESIRVDLIIWSVSGINKIYSYG